jgi:hypothetical protein
VRDPRDAADARRMLKAAEVLGIALRFEGRGTWKTTSGELVFFTSGRGNEIEPAKVGDAWTWRDTAWSKPLRVVPIDAGSRVLAFGG